MPLLNGHPSRFGDSMLDDSDDFSEITRLLLPAHLADQLSSAESTKAAEQNAPRPKRLPRKPSKKPAAERRDHIPPISQRDRNMALANSLAHAAVGQNSDVPADISGAPANTREPTSGADDAAANSTETRRQPSHSAKVFEEAFTTTCVFAAASVIPGVAESSVIAYVKKWLDDAGDPRDSVERTLLQSMLLCHHLASRFSCRASVVDDPTTSAAFACVAARLMSETRKTGLAIREYRSRPNVASPVKSEHQSATETEPLTNTEADTTEPLRNGCPADGKNLCAPNKEVTGNVNDPNPNPQPPPSVCRTPKRFAARRIN